MYFAFLLQRENNSNEEGAKISMM